MLDDDLMKKFDTFKNSINFSSQLYINIENLYVSLNSISKIFIIILANM